MDWYISIARMMGRAEGMIGKVKDGLFDEETSIMKLAGLLWDIKGELDSLQRYLLIATDIKRVMPFEQCLSDARNRTERIAIPPSTEGRIKARLLGLRHLEDRWYALSLMMENARQIYSNNHWFDLSNRPEIREH